MNLRNRAITALVLSIVLIGLAILVWANQTGRITIFGAGETITITPMDWAKISASGSPSGCGIGSNCDSTFNCPNHSILIGLRGIPNLVGSGVGTNLNFYTEYQCANITVGGLPTTRAAYSPDPKFTRSVDNSGYNIGGAASCPTGTFAYGYSKSGDAVKCGIITANINGAVITETSNNTVPMTIIDPNVAPILQQYESDCTPSGNAPSNLASGLGYSIDTSVPINRTSTPYLRCGNSLTLSGGADTTVPTPPTNLTAAMANATTCSDILLSWTASTDNVGVAGYSIYNGDTNEKINTTTGTTWTVSGATGSTAYKYYVKAYDVAGNTSDSSNVASITTPACTTTCENAGGQCVALTPEVTCPTGYETDSNTAHTCLIGSTCCKSSTVTKPSKPSNIKSQAQGCQEVKVSWDASTSGATVTGYSIYSSDNKLLTTTNNTEYVFKGLSGQTTYKYYVTAHDSTNNVSDPSDTTSVTTPLCPVPIIVQPSSLVTTGGSLWFNILLAIIISGFATFFLLRKRANY